MVPAFKEEKFLTPNAGMMSQVYIPAKFGCKTAMPHSSTTMESGGYVPVVAAMTTLGSVWLNNAWMVMADGPDNGGGHMPDVSDMRIISAGTGSA